MFLTIVVALSLVGHGAYAVAVPFYNGTGRVNICTSEYTPMVYCTDRDPSAYSGYEIELFAQVTQVLGWEPSMMNWTCMAWDDMLASLASGDGQCDIAVAGVSVLPENIDQGISFSRPTYRNGLTIVVKNTQKTSGLWAFWQAFTWQLWLIAVCTAVGVAIFIWGIDYLYYKYTMERFSKDPLTIKTPQEEETDAFLENEHQFFRYFWEAVTRPMMTRDMYAYTQAGNIVANTFGFAMLILYTLYLGNTAANLTIMRLDTGGIIGIESLPGKAVGTWADYVPKLRKYGVSAAGYPWDNTADEEAMFEALKSGAIRALVLDSALLDYVAATDCDISVVGSSFEQYEQAIAFPKGFNETNNALMNKIDEVLIQLYDNGADESIAATYVTPPASVCTELYSAKVTLSQVLGLWVILGCCVLIAFAWLLIVKLYENRKKRRIQHSVTTGVEKEMDQSKINNTSSGDDASE